MTQISQGQAVTKALRLHQHRCEISSLDFYSVQSNHKRNLAINNGGGGAKLTVRIWNFILQRSQIQKNGKLVP
jgi:hypothetical protein